VADNSSRNETLSKLAQSRAEIRRVLDPPPRISNGQRREGAALGSEGYLQQDSEGGFPRSRTMRLLMSGRGLGTVGAVVGGLIMARPGLAFKLARMLPTGAVAKMLLLKAFTSFRSRD